MITDSFCEKDIERFWSKVDIRGEDDCWEWKGRCNKKDGYGRFQFKKKYFRAHRIAGELIYGTMPEDKPFVCHTCDNPPCCNLNHFFAGDHDDNMLDAREKGHFAKGEKRRSTAKLIENQVNDIRERYAESDASPAELATQFGVTNSAVSNILRGRTWAHVGGPLVEHGLKKKKRTSIGTKARIGCSKLTEPRVEYIKNKYAHSDISQTELARMFGVHSGIIMWIVRGKTWTHVPGPITTKEMKRGGKHSCRAERNSVSCNSTELGNCWLHENPVCHPVPPGPSSQTI